jgi:DNA helicase II / ATP-dependent DNA helicase PcrA
MILDAMSLNPSQLEAVKTLSGPLLVLAGAGTGKTRVVTYRIANLIRHRTPPERILAVTFTNKAAGEMQQRAAELLGKRFNTKPEISTFHSLCVRILRRQIQHLGYPRQFTIFDRGDQEGTARQVLREIRAGNEALKPGDLLFFIGKWKTAALGPDEALEIAASDKEHLAATAYRRYQAALKAAGAVDFDDLLLLVGELFEQFPDVRQQEAARFSQLLIDEYQDTNASQYRIVKALASDHRNLCVVGDDDQSIYGWRGAEVEHILRFHDDWPEAKVVRLEDNYRTMESILEFANRLIAFNKLRHDKVLRPSRCGGDRPTIVQCKDEQNEAEQVVADIQRRFLEGAQPRDVAILCRTNEQPRPFEMELRRLKLPYVLIGGQSFYDRREVKDILAYLRLLDNPRDEPSLLRILNTPPRGIGQATVSALLEKAIQQGKPLWEILPEVKAEGKITLAAAEAVHKFRAMIESFRHRLEVPHSVQPHSPLAPGGRGAGGEGEDQQTSQTNSLVYTATSLVAQINYHAELVRQHPEEADQQSRWASVQEVINSLGAYEKRAKKPSLRTFLDEIALGERDEQGDKESKLDRNAIVLMTLHAAKGLEFPHVYLVGMEEGLLPHQRSVDAEKKQGDLKAIDEERRLCYVGVTRARDRLTMSLALSRMKWGKPRPTEPSRFLYELTGQAENRGKRKAAEAKAAAQARAGRNRRPARYR